MESCTIMCLVDEIQRNDKDETENAEVAELADAHGSGPCGSNTVRVQVSSSARSSDL